MFQCIYPRFQAFYNGLPLANGSIKAYYSKTSIPALLYDSLGNSSYTITLDSNGIADFWVDDGFDYTYNVYDSLGNLIISRDSLHGLLYPANANLYINGGLTLSANLIINGSIITATNGQSFFITPVGTGVTAITNAKLTGNFSTGNVNNNIKLYNNKLFVDNNSNTLITWGVTASAVNSIGIANNSTNNSPIISCGGANSDTNISIQLSSKGTNLIKIQNNTLDCTVPSGVRLFKTDGAGNVAQFSSQAPWGYIDGLILSNDGSSPNTILDISPGMADSEDHAVTMSTSSIWKKSLNNTWVAGTGNGGRASGVSYSANTWYHVFIISNSTGTTVDFGFDTDLNAVNLLSGSFVKYRRIGSIYTDGSSNIISFLQIGNTFLWGSPRNDYSNTVVNSLFTTIGVSVPFGLRSTVIGNMHQSATWPSFTSESYIGSLYAYPDTFTSLPVPNNIISIGTTSGPYTLSGDTGDQRVLTNTSSQIKFALTTQQSLAAATITVSWTTIGWVDSRRSS